MREYFLIQGRNRLQGTIRVNGAKNHALKVLSAAVLAKDRTEITNLPQIEDVFRMNELLSDLGAKFSSRGGCLTIYGTNISNWRIKSDIGKSFRASVVAVGSVLARNRRARFPHPGGCVIGERPIDLFLDGWRSMGVKIKKRRDYYDLTAAKIRGCNFTFKNPTVTGTETLMLTAVLAHGVTVLKNASLEPEVKALADCLKEAGVKILGAGTPKIHIVGRKGRLLNRIKAQIIPDRIEAGSFLALGALIANRLKIINCNPEHLEVPLEILRLAGVPASSSKDQIIVSSPKRIKAVDFRTREYPGFPTDLQAPFTVLMTQAEGQTVILETIFEGRLRYIEELNRMGAFIQVVNPYQAIIQGPASLRGREIETPDLRGGLAFVLAALIAKGTSKIHNVYQIDRGYETIEKRLGKIGANIRRIKEDYRPIP